MSHVTSSLSHYSQSVLCRYLQIFPWCFGISEALLTTIFLPSFGPAPQLLIHNDTTILSQSLILETRASSLVHFSPLFPHHIKFQIPLILLPHHHSDSYLLAPAPLTSPLDQHNSLLRGLGPGILSFCHPLCIAVRLIIEDYIKTPIFKCSPNKDEDPYTTKGPTWITSNHPFQFYFPALSQDANTRVSFVVFSITVLTAFAYEVLLMLKVFFSSLHFYILPSLQVLPHKFPPTWRLQWSRCHLLNDYYTLST